MKKIFRNTIQVVIVLSMMILVSTSVYATSDDEYENNLTYYQELCRGIESESVKATCDGYRSFLERRAGNKEAERAEIANRREKIDTDLKSNLSILGEYEGKIKDLETQIKSLEAQIVQNEAQIALIEIQIAQRLEDIKGLEEDIKAYMVKSQSTMRVNGYIEFLMGATDFSDIIRRVEGLNAIKRSNEKMIDAFKEQQLKLQEDRALIENEKFAIELNKKAIESERELAKAYEAEIQYVYAKLSEQKDILDVADAQVQNEITISNDLASQIGDLVLVPKPEPEKPDPEKPVDPGNPDPENPDPENPGPGEGSTDIYHPVPGTSLTATVWQYPWGGWHLGNDLGADIGTPLRAIGNGVIVVAQGGCGNNADGCNGGLGNHISMIFQDGDHSYGALFMHLSSTAVGQLAVVPAGTVIGYTGNSGTSTGPHVHIEIFDMGPGTVVDGLNLWNNGHRTAQFGLGGSSGGNSSLCDYRGSYPCRTNPGRYVYST